MQEARCCGLPSAPGDLKSRFSASTQATSPNAPARRSRATSRAPARWAKSATAISPPEIIRAGTGAWPSSSKFMVLPTQTAVMTKRRATRPTPRPGRRRSLPPRDGMPKLAGTEPPKADPRQLLPSVRHADRPCDRGHMPVHHGTVPLLLHRPHARFSRVRNPVRKTPVGHSPVGNEARTSCIVASRRPRPAKDDSLSWLVFPTQCHRRRNCASAAHIQAPLRTNAFIISLCPANSPIRRDTSIPPRSAIAFAANTASALTVKLEASPAISKSKSIE